MGISAALGSSALLPAGLGFRNKVMNGGMVIAQRGTSAVTGSGSAQYPVDRFVVYNGTGTVTFQQSSIAPTGFTNSIVATVTSTGSYGTSGYTQIGHHIEGYNVADLAWGTASAKPIVLSFWCRSSVTGSYNVAFQNGSQGRSYTATFTVNAANTWESKTVYVNGDTTGTWTTDNTAGLRIWFNLGMGSNYDTTANTWGAGNVGSTSGAVDFAANSGATFYLTGVQLEQNYQPTPFEQRPIGVELQLCQRYYWRYANATLNGGGLGYITGFSATRGFGYIYIPTEMRGAITITPTSCQFDSLGLSNVGNITALAVYPTVANAANTTTLMVDCTLNAGGVAGTLYHFRVASGGAIQFSAEL